MVTSGFLAWVHCKDKKYKEEQVWKVLWTELCAPKAIRGSPDSQCDCIWR